jgi:predicted  nucleic acid-binding Zn-ribbon protein
MNIQDIEILLDRKLDEKLDTKLTQQREEFIRDMNVALEQYQSLNRVGYEVLNGKIDGVTERLDNLEIKVDSIQEMVAKNTEDISSLGSMVEKNTEDISEIKDSLRVRVR